jgi:PAS domain S-box-containing protein
MKYAETRLFSLTRRQQYGIAILTVALATGIRLVLDPFLGEELPFFFFVFPLVISSALGGLWPGLAATGLSLVAGDAMFIQPRGSLFVLDTPAALTQALSVGFVGVFFSVVFDWTRKAAMAEWLERRVAQERIEFLLDLNEALLPLADADQIISLSMRMLGEHLRADRCEYAEAEEGTDHFAVLGSFTRFTTGEDRSVASVPLKRDDRFAVKVSVYQKTPRRWSDEELRLINIVANRCWESAVRARAVKRLADSDERYRAFIANSSEAIWRYELEKPIPVTLPEQEQIELFFQHAYTAECNDAFARSHGRSSVDEILGERVKVLFVRSEPEKIMEYARTFVRSRYHLVGAETEERDPHGNTRHFLSNLTGILENGALARLWGTQQDITDRKDAQAERERLLGEIETERDLLRQILEQMPIGVSIAEAPSGRLIFHNLEAIRLLRHPLLRSETYSGYAQYGALHEDGTAFRPEEYPAVRSLLSGEVVTNEELRYRRGDGTETAFSVNSAPIYNADGRMILTVVTFIDIAERKQAEATLREAEERFSKAFRASPDSLVISRVADGHIIEVNESFVSQTGYTRDELVGHSAVSLGLHADPDDRQRMVEILREQNYVRNYEFRLRRKTGEIRLIQFSAEPVELRGEHCWLTIGHDITERKQWEEELQRLFRQEKAAREAAETANRMKDQFLATVSHELRTPLTSILGWSSMLMKESLPEAQSRHALDVIARSARSQCELIDDILDMSRIVTGRLKLESRPVEIENVFRAAVDIIRPSAAAKRIELESVAPGATCKVWGDASRLQQAIWNLLSNAVKFTGEGGHIKAQLDFSPSQVEISITDNGTGIDPDFLPYVFERFRQADSSSTRRYGGLGLGLTIVHHVVEMHGGVVSAFSAGKGHGSTFRIILPLMERLNEPESAVVLESKPESALTTASKQKNHLLDHVRILVVEDDQDTLDLLKLVLRDSGADVATAPSVKEAIGIFENWHPDLLVSDIAMPEEDGYQLIGQVRAHDSEHGGNIPAVALTAYVTNDDKKRSLSAGFQVHLTKPIRPEELINTLARLSGRTTHSQGD